MTGGSVRLRRRQLRCSVAASAARGAGANTGEP